MKYFAFLLVLVLFFTSCSSTAPIVSAKKEDVTGRHARSEKRKTDQLADQLIDSATQYIGVKYKYGGTTKEGFDCSGLTYTLFNAENIMLPRISYEQAQLGVVINQKHEEAQKGDLIFFKTNKNKAINHVGIVIEATDEEIKFIHSSTSKGVIISSTKEPYYQKTFVQINRVL